MKNQPASTWDYLKKSLWTWILIVSLSCLVINNTFDIGVRLFHSSQSTHTSTRTTETNGNVTIDTHTDSSGHSIDFNYALSTMFWLVPLLLTLLSGYKVLQLINERESKIKN